MIDVVEHLNKLQKKLDETGSFYVFYRDRKNDDYKILAKEATWKKAEKVLIKKLKKFKKLKKLPKYTKKSVKWTPLSLFLVYILLTAISINLDRLNIVKEDLDLVGGPLSVTVRAMSVNKDLSIGKYIYDCRAQAVWYTKKELSKRKFSFGDLRKITKVVNEKKVDMHPFAKPSITNVLALY
jgi:hypothetical protein